jgi:purine-nucleoside phosphorylase
MVYGELGKEALKWATEFEFGLNPESVPSRVVITPLKVEDCFKNFQITIIGRGLMSEAVGDGILVWKGGNRALFCEGGIGSSNFADASYILCHLDNVKEIIFVGTGGGLGEHVESADVHVPSSCIRLDKVLELILPLEAPARADPGLTEKLISLIKGEVLELGVRVHSGLHATVPFFLSETKSLLKDLQKQGALSVDMELSVLYALANHYHKKAAGVVRIGDLPLGGLPAWKSRSFKRELKDEVHARILSAIIKYLFKS